MVWELNNTFVTLVPKTKGAEELDEFCPISCVNTLYKIHSKLMTDRMTEVVSNLVSGNQAAFLAGKTDWGTLENG